MGNTAPEIESMEQCRYTVMFTILSSFTGISAPPKESLTRVYLLASAADRAPNLLGPTGAVQGTVLDGRAQMLRGDVFGCFQVGYGAGHFQDAVVGARGKAQPGDGIF